MGEFQLIVLSEVDRTAVRKARHSGAFPLTHPGAPSEWGMASLASYGQREISAEEVASWWAPIEAATYGIKCVASVKRATNAIWQRLVAGQIEAVAMASSATVRDRQPVPSRTPALIPRHFWTKFTAAGSDLWSAGDARFFIPSGMSTKAVTTFHCFGIRFNPDDVRATLPPPLIERPRDPEGPGQSASATNKGGRPRNDWWEDFWVDICGQIYEGTLVPKRQADLERAMLEWATKHGHNLSEAYARQKAKKLFTRLENVGLKT
jgi:hypothetical protein